MWKKLFVLALIPMMILGLSACDVTKTEEGEAPDVDVEGGNMPEYDVEAGDVDIDSEEVDVPDTVEVPTIDIQSPEEQDAEEAMGAE